MPEHKHDPSDDPQQNLIDQACQQMIRFLTGESTDAAVLQQAIQVLQIHAPQRLAQFPQTIREVVPLANNIHAYVLSQLPEYLDLGADALRLMPYVHEHLAACEACQQELAILAKAAKSMPDWVAFSAVLSAASAPTAGQKLILLVGKTWHWFDTQTKQILSELTEKDAIFGQWQLRSVLDEARTLVASRLVPIPLPLGVTLTLPGNIMKLEVDIVPDAPEQQDIWHIIVKQHPTPDTPSDFIVQVACGHDDKRLSGFRALTDVQSVDFERPPAPAGHPHQLFVRYILDDTTHTAQFDIPVVVSEG